MAFRVPTQAPRRQQYSNNPPSQPVNLADPLEAVEDDSAQWVLFSPQPTSARTHTTSEDTQRAAERSRLSDFGSLGTETQSVGHGDHVLSDPLDEDGTELDSLDDGLHAFRAPSLSPDPDQGATTLPAHDGLGSFHASSQTVQDQLWQHEQYNPQRSDVTHRRHSSVQRQLDTVAESEMTTAERERWERIEKWRMDQSRAVLEEIEKETRRQRSSRASRASSDHVAQWTEVSNTPETPARPEDEPLWRRITRKVIRDIIGMDDSVLSIIFGESLSTEAETSSTASEGPDMDEAMAGVEPEGQLVWQSKLLHRVARELGILVHQFCEHPGAFSTYLQLTRGITNEYAGMPLEPLPEDPTQSTSASAQAGSAMSPHFAPTIRDPSREHEAHWGIEEESHRTDELHLQQERDYWERELDVMMVFRYLRNRFGRRGGIAETRPRRHPQDASRRAAIIRQHHPLVARAQSHNRRMSQHSGITGTGISSPILRQHFRRSSSSCASQSAKRSAISSRRTMTSSSRNYWDIGGSVDSGSAVAAGVGMWGEV